MPLIEMDYTLKSTNRADIRKEIVNLFLLEQAGTGTGELTSRAIYTVEQILSHTIFLERPARLNKGFDFTVNAKQVYFSSNFLPLMPRHSDIFDILQRTKNTYANYSIISTTINDIYNCKFYDGKVLSGIKFNDYNYNEHPIEIILLAIKWLFIEQDITYWNWSGRNMLMEGLQENGLA